MKASSGSGEWPSVKVRVCIATIFRPGEMPVDQNLWPTICSEYAYVNSFSNGFQGEIVRRPPGWRGVLHPSLPQHRSDPPALPKTLPAVPLAPPAPPLRLAASKNFFSSVRMRLVGTIFVAIAPPMAIMYYFHLENWAGFLVGLFALAAAWYGGERFMEASWVYRMSHPSHEDSNTAYGQLAWLNNRGGGTSFGAAIDRCAPAAFWLIGRLHLRWRQKAALPITPCRAHGRASARLAVFCHGKLR